MSGTKTAKSLVAVERKRERSSLFCVETRYNTYSLILLKGAQYIVEACRKIQVKFNMQKIRN